MDLLEKQIRELFAKVPFENTNLLDSDIIYALEVKKDVAYVSLVLDSARKNLQTSITNKIETILKSIEGINQVQFQIAENEQQLKQPPNTDLNQTSNSTKKNTYLQNYDSVIVVASGKGGVGKSSVAINLALALKSINKKVSLFDADIYGPSMPLMMGVRQEKPRVMQNQILPLSKYGIEFISIGNLVSESDSIVWRGPMVHQALDQLIRDTHWPGGDFMIIDMPPGTGDAQLSISQITDLKGAIIVCTPQDVALIDARRAIAMFEKVSVPILGMIENMSFFVCPNCQHEAAIFGKLGVQKEAQNFDISKF